MLKQILAAALAAVVLAGVGHARALGPVRQTETPGVQVSERRAEEQLPEPSTPPALGARNRRTLSAIVIHRAASWDGNYPVTVTLEGTPRELTLEAYLLGVLMGEMPAEFPLEALKAQAVAARTYTMHRLESGGLLSDDPAVCQAYYDPDRAAERFGDEAEYYLGKLRQALAETDGQVLTYEGALITATYFSCSGGRTESAREVWGGTVPYLTSVDSPGEEDAPPYETTVAVDLADFLEELEISDPTVEGISYTQGGGVDTLTLDGRTFTGLELRQRFALRSTCFSLEPQGDQMVFTVRGNGHRVGLSQYGAKAMADRGCGYGEILRWYYRGAELSYMA